MGLYSLNKKNNLYPSHCNTNNKALSKKEIDAILDIIIIKLKYPKLYGTVRNDINIIKHFLEKTQGYHYGYSKDFFNLTIKSGKTAILEHAYTANEEILDIVKLKINDRKSLMKHIMDNYSLCLITKEEDKKLRDKKYTKVRPGGWKKCYEDCGIKLIVKPGKI